MGSTSSKSKFTVQKSKFYIFDEKTEKILSEEPNFVKFSFSINHTRVHDGTNLKENLPICFYQFDITKHELIVAYREIDSFYMYAVYFPIPPTINISNNLYPVFTENRTGLVGVLTSC